jgi:hypothetical protein
MKKKAKKVTKKVTKKIGNDVDIIVYYVGNKPDTIYKYYNKPEIGEQPYAVIEGYWLPEECGNTNKYHFVENQNKRPMLMDKDWLLNKIIPDKNSVKYFDSIDEFLLEMI